MHLYTSTKCLTMAYRIQLCTAGLLLLSAHIVAMQNMERLGEDALTHLEKEAALVLRNHTGSHSVGCIKEAKENEHLSCSLISTFVSYLQEAAHLDGLDTELHNKLKNIIQHVDDLKNVQCMGHFTTCKAAFQGRKLTLKNIEKLRSLLVLFKHWIVKPLE